MTPTPSLALQGRTCYPLPEQVRSALCLNTLSSLATLRGRVLLEMAHKTQRHLPPTHGQQKLLAISYLGASLERQGSGVNNKAGKIHP